MKSPHPIRIVYMEDDRGLARLFQKRMHRHGYEVDIAYDGEQGIAMFENNSYDIMAVDQQMPRRTGLEVIRTLASRGPIPPTIMITGAGNEKIAVEAMKLGASDYIIKDSDGGYLDLIPAVVEQALRSKSVLEDKDRTEQALQASEERYRQLVELSPDGICIEVDGTFAFVNNAAAQILGLSEPEDILGTRIDDWMHPSCRQLTAREHSVEMKFLRADGNVVDVEVSSAPLSFERSSLMVFRDVTHRKKAEETARRTEKLVAVADLATGVAHNFSNVLQVVMGEAQVALMNLEQRAYSGVCSNLDRIVDCSRQGLEILKRLHKFSRYRSGILRSRGLSLDLAASVAHALEISEVWWKAIPERNGVKIDLIRRLDAECMILGNETEILELTINLVKNAVEAMPDGGELTVSAYTRHGQVVLDVEDTGKGIPDNQKDGLFQPFFTTKGDHGTGMGLATARGIARAHSGTISVQSVLGKGSVFSVSFPSISTRLQDTECRKALRALSGITILIIDDMEPVVNLVKRALDGFGIKVLTALSGHEGLKMFQSSHVDLVICDLEMPGMRGWKVGREIKKICRRRARLQTPFILLTSLGFAPGDQGKLEESGVGELLEKPIDSSQLIRIITRLLREPRADLAANP
jgi:PAS domain S-box-containing protein